MEKDTVVISLKEYNALRDFKINTKEGLINITKYLGHTNNNPITESTYINRTNADQLLLTKIEDLEKNIKEYIQEKAVLRQRVLEYAKLADIENSKWKNAQHDFDMYKVTSSVILDRLANLSIISFISWRKEHNSSKSK